MNLPMTQLNIYGYIYVRVYLCIYVLVAHAVLQRC
jgi:hypothetical protein